MLPVTTCGIGAHFIEQSNFHFQSLDKASDCQLFIFKVNEVVANRNSESRYLLIERTPMAMPYVDPHEMTTEKKNSRVSW